MLQFAFVIVTRSKIQTSINSLPLIHFSMFSHAGLLFPKIAWGKSVFANNFVPIQLKGKVSHH
jgi:hypothetical protein